MRSDTASDYAVFVGSPEETVMYDFDMVKGEIERLTSIETKGTKIISSKPIQLRIYSQNVVTMRLVDLPGITKVAVDGQPDTVEVDTTNLVLDYIKSDNVIILAVIPANSDVANSDALKTAKMADPSFERTIGVLTKVDIMDTGTDVCGYLTGEEEPYLKLGYTAVINRNAEDTRLGVSLRDHILKEENWFKNNARSGPYRNVPNCGREALLNKLNDVFIGEVRRYIADMRDKVLSTLKEAQKVLIELQNPIESKGLSKDEFMIQVRNAYCDNVSDIINGNQNCDANKASHTALVREDLDKFQKDLREAAENASKYEVNELEKKIKLSQGFLNQLVVIDKPLAQLVVMVVEELGKKCYDLLKRVKDHLRSISWEALQCTQDLMGFPKLSQRFHELFEEVVQSKEEETALFIRHRLETEKLVNIKHKKFISHKDLVLEVKESKVGSSSAPLAPRGQASGQSEREEGPGPFLRDESSGTFFEIMCFSEDQKIKALGILLKSYCKNVVADSLAHGVPNTILVGLVNGKLEAELGKKLTEMKIEDSLLVEDEKTAIRREKYDNIIDSCTKALNFIGKLPKV